MRDKVALLLIIAALVGSIAYGVATRDDRAAAAAAKIAAEETAKAEERRKGFHCLSGWDGSHAELARSVKGALRDPASFEHVETRISPADAAGLHSLIMTYRARNGFGGMNIERAAARVRSDDCSVEIVAP